MTAHSAALESKIAKQRQEIARLNCDNARLRQENADLRHNWFKAEAALRQRETAND